MSWARDPNNKRLKIMMMIKAFLNIQYFSKSETFSCDTEGVCAWSIKKNKKIIPKSSSITAEFWVPYWLWSLFCGLLLKSILWDCCCCCCCCCVSILLSQLCFGNCDTRWPCCSINWELSLLFSTKFAMFNWSTDGPFVEWPFIMYCCCCCCWCFHKKKTCTKIQNINPLNDEKRKISNTWFCWFLWKSKNFDIFPVYMWFIFSFPLCKLLCCVRDCCWCCSNCLLISFEQWKKSELKSPEIFTNICKH